MTERDEIKKLRDQIDRVDEKILNLLNERVGIAQEIARIKLKNDSVDFYRPEREAQVLRKIMAQNEGPLPDEAVATLFREIMSAALAAEAPMRIGFLGPSGTYSHAAATKHFGKSVETLALATVDDVFQSVEKGEAHYGVVPIENSIEGVVTHTLDKFLDSPLQICGEVHVRIRHQLLSKSSDLKDIQAILAHSQSLAQCRRWIGAHLPNVKLEAVESNAEAARLAAQQPSSAAIASSEAGEIYALNILANDIEDDPANTTRFLVIGKGFPSASGDDKTSLLVSSKNKPGALHGLLGPFAKHNISMTRIESRPSRQAAWEYVFFIDIEGHKEETNINLALSELENEAAFLKILGAYPRSVL
ncbi:MAG: prephenate dehydratase [Arenicellales bacterium]|nr:prephenate dehydratase [Arenicellales bacterium]